MLFRRRRDTRAGVGHEHFVLVQPRRAVSAGVVRAHGFYRHVDLDRPGFADVCRVYVEPRSPGRQGRCDAAAGKGCDDRGFGDRGHADREIIDWRRASINAQVAAQIPKFREQVEAARRATQIVNHPCRQVYRSWMACDREWLPRRS